MKGKHSLLLMSHWYGKIRKLTIRSVKVPLGREFKKDLVDAFFRMLKTNNPFSEAGRLLRMYPLLRENLEWAIDRWGAVFIRGDSASPKDACYELGLFNSDLAVRHGIFHVPNTHMNACICTTPEAAVALLVMSERVMVIGEASTVWLRQPVYPRQEARIFVAEGKPRLVSWYYPWLPANADHFLPAVNRYLEIVPELVDKIGENFTADLALIKNKPTVIEVAPLPGEAPVDPILFKQDYEKQEAHARKNREVIIRYPALEGTHQVSFLKGW